MLTEKLLRRRLASSRLATIVTDEVLRVIFMNAPAERLLGYRVPRVKKGSPPPPDVTLNLTISSATTSTEFEGEIQTADGTAVTVTLEVTTIPGGCGISGFIFRLAKRVSSIWDQ